MAEAITAEQKKIRNAELKAKREEVAKAKSRKDSGIVVVSSKEYAELKAQLVASEKSCGFLKDRFDGVTHQLTELRKIIDNLTHTNEVLERIITNRKV